MLRLLLGAVYYLVVTPLGAAIRLVHDPLHRRRDPRARSYWTVIPAGAAGGRSSVQQRTDPAEHRRDPC